MTEEIKQITKEESENELKSILTKFTFSLFSQDNNTELRKKVYNEIAPRIFTNENISDEKKTDYLLKTLRKMGLDTKVQLAESIGEEHRSIAMGLADELIAEYDCKTASEKALTQIVANAFVRTMEYSQTLETCRDKTVKLNLFGYYSIIGKELDRANRHFLSSLMTLRQMKSPAIKINVTAKTAFMAENQQFNINKEEKTL